MSLTRTSMRLSSTGQESVEEAGVLYTVRVAERRPRPKRSTIDKLKSFFRSQNPRRSAITSTKTSSDAINVGNETPSEYRDVQSNINNNNNIVPQAPSPTLKNDRRTALSPSLLGELVLMESVRNFILDDIIEEENGEDQDGVNDVIGGTYKAGGSRVQRQFTISKKKQRPYGPLTYPVSFLSYIFGLNLGNALHHDVDRHLYKPSRFWFKYISWTFHTSFHAVIFSFMAVFIVLCTVFGAFLMVAGDREPECIVVSGEAFGTNPDTRYYDAFALSWTTFATVGYGNVYTATGPDFDSISHRRCATVVFLCTVEAFIGLLYAGMCAAILFGKVNRIQCHANVKFCNGVCLLYEPGLESYCSDSDGESSALEKEEKPVVRRSVLVRNGEVCVLRCPVLKFQVVNEHCNREGGDIVDASMKVVGVKMKTQNGRITHSQYVRVNLVDSEHPFFSRVWHGLHVLDATSPLLTHSARKKIRENGDAWPTDWFDDPEKIRKKLNFHSLILTINGTSNLSACTVHAYKRYSSGDLLIGFDFAPLVYFNDKSGSLEVDLSMVHDVREQAYGTGEDVKTGRVNRTSTFFKESFQASQQNT